MEKIGSDAFGAKLDKNLHRSTNLAIPRWREMHYTDDGCSAYQCLSCKESWEGRSSPEWGWKFCPYCGVKWEGQVKCRSSHTPRWRWELLEQPRELAYESKAEFDYEHYRKLEDHISEVHRRSEEKQSVWMIEYREIKDDARWYCEDAFMVNPYRDQDPSTAPVHQRALQWMREARDRHNAEREEGIKDFWGDEDENLTESDRQSLRDMRKRMYPEREWRIRLMPTKGEFQKLHCGRSYVRYV